MTRNRIEQHPEEYREDLNPDYLAGENYGQPTFSTHTAFDLKELHEALDYLRDDQLRQLPVIDPGGRLEQGAAYFDLLHPERGEFKALGSMVAGTDNAYVPKDQVPYDLWNLITGVDDPERLRTITG